MLCLLASKVNAAFRGLVVGVGAGILGIVAGSLHESEACSGRVRAVPLLGGGMNGAAVAGSF